MRYLEEKLVVVTVVRRYVKGDEVGEPLEEKRKERKGLNRNSKRVSETVGDGK
jgi:hypothetical protein